MLWRYGCYDTNLMMRVTSRKTDENIEADESSDIFIDCFGNRYVVPCSDGKFFSSVVINLKII